MGITAQEVVARTVKIVLPKQRRPYCHEDFVKVLTEVGFQQGEVEALGPVKSNREWHLTCSSVENKRKLVLEKN